MCRIDNYQDAQWRKVDFIAELQRKYDCVVLHGGDLFDHWKPSPNLLRLAIEHLPKKFHTVYGQHDLPQHNLNLAYKCGINTLWAGGHIKVLSGCHWAQEPDESHPTLHWESNTGQYWQRRILVWHRMNYQGKLPWPGCTDPMAGSILRKYRFFDLIVTGDNHKTFVEECDGHYLINPGSMMRMDADQVGHRPCVFLYYASDNTYQQVFLPIEHEIISRAHLERIEQRDIRIDTFVNRLNGEWHATMSYEDNLEAFRQAHNLRKSVMDIIYKALEC